MTWAPAIHIAAPMGDDRVQRCARCGRALKDLRDAHTIDPVVGPLAWRGGITYPEGALVAIGPGWQAMDLASEAPTCEP